MALFFIFFLLFSLPVHAGDQCIEAACKFIEGSVVGYVEAKPSNWSKGFMTQIDCDISTDTGKYKCCDQVVGQVYPWINPPSSVPYCRGWPRITTLQLHLFLEKQFLALAQKDRFCSHLCIGITPSFLVHPASEQIGLCLLLEEFYRVVQAPFPPRQSLLASSFIPQSALYLSSELAFGAGLGVNFETIRS